MSTQLYKVALGVVLCVIWRDDCANEGFRFLHVANAKYLNQELGWILNCDTFSLCKWTCLFWAFIIEYWEQSVIYYLHRDFERSTALYLLSIDRHKSWCWKEIHFRFTLYYMCDITSLSTTLFNWGTFSVTSCSIKVICTIKVMFCHTFATLYFI